MTLTQSSSLQTNFHFWLSVSWHDNSYVDAGTTTAEKSCIWGHQWCCACSGCIDYQRVTTWCLWCGAIGMFLVFDDTDEHWQSCRNCCSFRFRCSITIALKSSSDNIAFCHDIKNLGFIFLANFSCSWLCLVFIYCHSYHCLERSFFMFQSPSQWGSATAVTPTR